MYDSRDFDSVSEFEDFSDTDEWGDFVDDEVEEGLEECDGLTSDEMSNELNLAVNDEIEIADFPTEEEPETEEFQTEAEKAADYARSLGFDKAADYIERHYDGEEFTYGGTIPITTRNMALEGLVSDNGVPFERREVELTDGLTVEGVFPEFESIHHVDLGSAANDMNVHQQFSACKEEFQEHMFDDREKLRDLTSGAMEKLNSPQGYTPEGYTWQHNPETGSFDLVTQKDHAVGHTGGNALWGKTT